MDSQYHDLYIKFKGFKKEKIFERGIIHSRLFCTIEIINNINRIYQIQYGKALIDYIRID